MWVDAAAEEAVNFSAREMGLRGMSVARVGESRTGVSCIDVPWDHAPA